MQQHIPYIPLILLKKKVKIKKKFISCLDNQDSNQDSLLRCHKGKAAQAVLVKNNDNYHDDINNHINGYKKYNNDNYHDDNNDYHDDINNHINGYKKYNDINDSEEYWIDLIYHNAEHLNVEDEEFVDDD